jgi:HD-like signal output (HDOD) protein
LADNFGKDYVMMFEESERRRSPLQIDELLTYEASHADVGGYLLGLWGLPQNIIEAVAFHHDPVHSTDMRFTPLTAVHVANIFCRCDADKDPMSAGLDLEYLHRLGMAKHVEHWREIAYGAVPVA